jgi:hypothetical protein
MAFPKFPNSKILINYCIREDPGTSCHADLMSDLMTWH